MVRPPLFPASTAGLWSMSPVRLAVSINWGAPFVGVPVITALQYGAHTRAPEIFGNSHLGYLAFQGLGLGAPCLMPGSAPNLRIASSRQARVCQRWAAVKGLNQVKLQELRNPIIWCECVRIYIYIYIYPSIYLSIYLSLYISLYSGNLNTKFPGSNPRSIRIF